MDRSSLREYAILSAVSASGGMALLAPLYLAAQGHPAGVVGLLAGIGGIGTLLSRLTMPFVYRPERSVWLLALLSAATAATTAALPYLPDLVAFGAVLFVNRGLSGLATAVYLARLEPTRWGTLILGVACLVLPVLVLRLQQLAEVTGG